MKTIRTPKAVLRRRTTPGEGPAGWGIGVEVAHESWGHCGMIKIDVGGHYVQQPICADQMLELAADLIATARALNPPEVDEEPPAQAA